MKPQEIVRMISEIEKTLEQEGVPLPFRTMHALGRLAKRLDREIWADDELSQVVQAWYRRRYGDRLNGSVLLGKMPILLRGNVFALLLKPRVEMRGGKAIPEYEWSLDAGPFLLESLTAAERSEVDDHRSLGFHAFSELAPHTSERALSPEATADLDVACERLLQSEGPDTNLSIWASQQAAEKSLKEFLRASGEAVPKIHDLFRLHRRALECGLPDLREAELPEGAVLDLLNVSTGARYGEEEISPERAVAGHHAALLVCFTVAVKLRIAAGGRNWLSLKDTSPAGFVIRRIAEMAGVRHAID